MADASNNIKVYADFLANNRDGIQGFDLEKKIYYISRRWTLRGPVPPGITVQSVGMPSRRHAMTEGQRRRIIRDSKGKKGL